jgi:transcription initiation factor TFIIIB Brf1 subunit/transcription initiation factor TFIIB
VAVFAPAAKKAAKAVMKAAKDEDGGVDWGKVGTGLALAALIMALGCCLR